LFSPSFSNLALVTGADGIWITKHAVDLHVNGPGASVLPLYIPEDLVERQDTLFEENLSRFAINKLAVEYFQKSLGASISEEELFYYCFGILSLSKFQKKFESDIRKMKARVPVSKEFFKLSELGRSLASVQLEYESLKPHPLVISGTHKTGKISKLRLSKVADNWAVEADNQLKISGIPQIAFDHKIFGRSPLEWVIDRYQLTEDSESGLVNDPNSYSDEQDFVVNMIGRAVTMSIEMSALLEAAPNLEFLKI
jgi:predicted helicase